MAENNLLDQLKKATETRLSGDFVVELIKCCFTSQKVFDICKAHLKYHYLHSEAQKKIVKFLFDSFDVSGKIPTIGIVGQSYSQEKEVISLLSQVKKTDIPNDVHEAILNEFETFIKKSRFIALYSKTGELFNQGKQEEATDVLAKESAEIVNFKLRDKYYTRIFADFDKRQDQRQITKDKVISRYCIWGIHELDDRIRGIQYGRSALIMARSGGGKSTMMKWVALANARLGKKVLHIQLEGTEDEANNAYDSAWTSITLDDMETGTIPGAKASKIRKSHHDILGSGGEIFVYAAEQFDSMSIEEIREVAIDVEKIHGDIDLIVIDYLPKCNVAGHFVGEHGERRRRLAIGDKMANMAVEFNCALLTGVQAEDVKPSDYNKPDFVMTRSNTSENKSQTEPFSYFITINQTNDESENGIARLFIDKCRAAKRGGEAVRIYQALDRGRFYDASRSIEFFYKKTVAK
jgi:hypothetical protein